MSRLINNIEICDKLKEFFIKNPTLRFFQVLQILRLQNITSVNFDDLYISDNFNEESSKTYKNLNESLSKV